MTLVLLLSPHNDEVELGGGGSMAELNEPGHERLRRAFWPGEDPLPIGMPKDAWPGRFKEAIGRCGLGEGGGLDARFLTDHRPRYRKLGLAHLHRAS